MANYSIEMCVYKFLINMQFYVSYICYLACIEKVLFKKMYAVYLL